MNSLQKKKLAFMSIANRIKGFVQTVTGALPLTLTNCVDNKSIINYKLYGKCVQDGIPTPDTPIEIQSVGDLTTKNLFDLSSSGGFVSDYAGVSCDINGDVATVNYTGSSGRTFYMNLGTFETGTYYFGADVKDIESVTNGKFHIRKVDDNSILNSINNVVTLTEPTEIKFYGTFNTGGTVEISNIQITKSDVPTEYEPYHKYKVPVKVCGKNIFDKNSVELTNKHHLDITTGKPVTFYGDRCATIKPIDVSNYKEITVSYSNVGVYFMYSLFDNENNLLTRKAGKSSGDSIDVSNASYIYISFYNVTAEIMENIQIEKGTVATDYEPYHEPITTHIYLDEPLRKVGDYADYIDFKNQKVVRNIIRQSLHAHSIYKKLNSVIRIDGFSGKDIKHKLDSHILSTIFNYNHDWVANTEYIFHHNKINWNYYWSVYWSRLGLTYDGTNVYRTDDASQTPLTDSEIISIANEWLSTLPDKDKEIYMILDTPTEESVSLPTLKTFKGTSIMSVNTSIQPSNAEITYYSSLKE